MENNDVLGQIQEALRITQLAKGFGQGLSDMLKRRRNSQSNGPVDNQRMLRDLLVQNAEDTVASLDLTTEAAFHMLGPEFESENVLDPTWQKRWITGVTNVSADDEERRTWWARLLAGEIQTPGSYSLRTLSIMDNLSPREARLFRLLCSCVWRTDGEDLIVMMPNAGKGWTWRMEPREANALAETGLVSKSPLGYHLNLTEGRPIPLSNRDLDVLLVPTATTRFPSSTMVLSTSGREVLRLVEIGPDRNYMRQMLIKLKECGQVYRAVRTPSGWRHGEEVAIPPDENCRA